MVHWETLTNISEFLQDYTADFAGMGYMAELVGDTCVLSNEPGSKLALARVPAVTISGTKNTRRGCLPQEKWTESHLG